MHIVSGIKKYQKELPIKILGATSLLPIILVISTILILCPFYVIVLKNAPGASVAHFVVLAIIYLVLGIIRTAVFDTFDIQYRFWSKILPMKWLSYIVLACYYSSFFIVLIVLFYFPNWIVVSLLGIYLGIVQPPIPSKYGSGRYNFMLSYDQLYEIYITNAILWEKRIEKKRKN